MKKRIYLSICFVALISMFLLTVASIAVFYDFFKKQVKSDIQNEAFLVKQGFECAQDKNSYLESLKKRQNNVRISIVDFEGNVIFDTNAVYQILDNHKNRPEVISAFEKGYGESIRYSDTLKTNTYYYALKLSEDTVIRLSDDLSSMVSVFQSILPFIIIITFILFAVCLIIVKRIANKIIRPLTTLGDHLDDMENITYYDELSPFVSMISHQNKTIKAQLEKLKDERDTINVITDNMKEGLVLISKDKKILSVNKSAIAFLNATPQDFLMKNIIMLTRDQSVLFAISQSLNGENKDGIILINERYYHYFASAVYENNMVHGAILLILDVTEKKKADQIRQEFSSNVSHELKTPLTTISGFAELLENDMVKSKQDYINFGQIIHKEALRLLSLIDDIMRLSQIEEGVDTEMIPIDVSMIAKDICERLMYKAKERNVSIQSESKKSIINANPSMINELIYNLLDNAIKYNKDGGSAFLKVEPNDSSVIISVFDTGIGIQKEHQDRIFERFYRVDKSRSKQTGGTGLGLSIVKHVVEYHKGEIKFESEEDKGTKITVILPK